MSEILQGSLIILLMISLIVFASVFFYNIGKQQGKIEEADNKFDEEGI